VISSKERLCLKNYKGNNDAKWEIEGAKEVGFSSTVG
jgi:hypothetical protein